MAKGLGMPRLQTLRRNVRRARETRGWSRRQLAQAAGLTPTTVYRLEKGSNPPRLDSVIAIADALEVTVCDLIADGTSRVVRSGGRRAPAPPDRVQCGEGRQAGVATLSEDAGLCASLGLKRAELARLWELSSRLARIGIDLITPLQAIRALDLLRSLEPGPRAVSADGRSMARRQRPGREAHPKGSG